MKGSFVRQMMAFAAAFLPAAGPRAVCSVSCLPTPIRKITPDVLKRHFIPFALLCASLTLAACGDSEETNTPLSRKSPPGTNHHVLVAYFSEPLPDGVDANTSASRVIVDGDLCMEA